MLENERHLFRVTDLKEYQFCPRVVYYENCLPDLQPSTFKMQAGVMAHERERRKADRRTLRAYHLLEGERRFDVALRDDEMGLTGEIDEVVLTEAGVYVVDYKLSRKIGMNFKLQVAAYTLLLESVWEVRVLGAFIYLIPKREAVEIKLTSRLRKQVITALAAMRQIVEEERMPPPPNNTRQCFTCKHRRFCNDVV